MLPVRPPPHVASLRRSFRASAIPWTTARATRRRQVSWLAGQGLMHGLPRPRMLQRPAQWLLAYPVWSPAYASRSPLTVAGTAAELKEPALLTAFPIKPLSGHRRDLARPVSRPGGVPLFGRTVRSKRASAQLMPCRSGPLPVSTAPFADGLAARGRRSRRCLARGLKRECGERACPQLRGCPCNCKRRARCTSPFSHPGRRQPLGRTLRHARPGKACIVP